MINAIIKKALLILSVVLSFTTASLAQQQTCPHLTLIIERDGRVSVNVKLETLTNVQIPNLTLIAFPFQFNENIQIESSDDVSINIIAKGKNYTLLSVVQLDTVQDILFKINSAFNVQESTIDRESLEFDFNYPYMSRKDKDLCNSKVCFSFYDIDIIFPEEVSTKQISHNPNSWKRIDAQEYFISESAIVVFKQKKDKVWIAFPEFNKMPSLVANTSITVFITILGLLTSPFILRNRSKFDKILLLILSIIAGFGSFYIIYIFWNRGDYLAWVIRGGGIILISLYFISNIIYQFIKGKNN